jgi:hypothetical protein
MTNLKEAIDQLIASTDLASQQLELLERVLKGLNSPEPERRLADRIPLYPSRRAKRESLCQLRWRHLQSVTAMARDPDYDRDETMAKLLGNYEWFFGRLRFRRRDEVPSDSLRKFFIVSAILDQVDARRAWLINQSLNLGSLRADGRGAPRGG